MAIKWLKTAFFYCLKIDLLIDWDQFRLACKDIILNINVYIYIFGIKKCISYLFHKKDIDYNI